MGGSVYAFAGGKGGVGKTTTTANVAIALAEKGFEVGAVDADLGMTNLGQFLDVESGRGIHELLAGEVALADVLVEGPAGVQVVPGGDDPAASANADPSNLRRAVEPLQERVDVVVLDTGAGLSHQNLVAYGLSDAIAVVTTPDSVAVGDADKSADMAARVDSPLVGTVLTRVNGATDLGGLRPSLEREVVAAIPEYDRPDAPEPRVLEAPDSPAAAEYRRLATTVAVCHQTGDVDEAASEANDAVDLPEPPADEGTEPGASEGLLGDLIGRLSPGD